MTSNEIINALILVKRVQTRYEDEDGNMVYDYLDVMYHPSYSHDMDSFPEHFTFEFDDAAILFTKDIEKVIHLSDGWMSFDDRDYGAVDFRFD